VGTAGRSLFSALADGGLNFIRNPDRRLAVTERSPTSRTRSVIAAVMALAVVTGLGLLWASHRKAASSSLISTVPAPATQRNAETPGRAHVPQGDQRPPFYKPLLKLSNEELIARFHQEETRGWSSENIDILCQMLLVLSQRGEVSTALGLAEGYPGQASDRQVITHELLLTGFISHDEMMALLPARRDLAVRRAFLGVLMAHDSGSSSQPSKMVCDFLTATAGGAGKPAEDSGKADFSGPPGPADRQGVIEALKEEMKTRLGAVLPHSLAEATTIKETSGSWLESLPTLTAEERSPLINELTPFLGESLPFDAWELNLANSSPVDNYCRAIADQMLKADPERAAAELKRATPEMADAMIQGMREIIERGVPNELPPSPDGTEDEETPAPDPEVAARFDKMARPLFEAFLAKGDLGRANAWLQLIADPADRAAAEKRLIILAAPR